MLSKLLMLLCTVLAGASPLCGLVPRVSHRLAPSRLLRLLSRVRTRARVGDLLYVNAAVHVASALIAVNGLCWLQPDMSQTLGINVDGMHELPPTWYGSLDAKVCSYVCSYVCPSTHWLLRARELTAAGFGAR